MFGLVGFPKRHGVELTPSAVLVSSLASAGAGISMTFLLLAGRFEGNPMRERGL
jgi:hypothetical protein